LIKGVCSIAESNSVNNGFKIIEEPSIPITRINPKAKKITMNGSTTGLTIVPNIVNKEAIQRISLYSTMPVMATGTVTINP
jgi:hypothetical protein